MQPLRTKKVLSQDHDGVSLIMEYEADAYAGYYERKRGDFGPWQKSESGGSWRVGRYTEGPTAAKPECLQTWRIVADVEVDGVRALDWLAYHLKDQPITEESWSRMIEDLSQPPIHHEPLQCLYCTADIPGTQTWRALGRVFTCRSCGQRWKVCGSCPSMEWFDYHLEKEEND